MMNNSFGKYIVIFYLCVLAGLADLTARPVRTLVIEDRVANKSRFDYAIEKLPSAGETVRMASLPAAYRKATGDDVIIGLLDGASWDRYVPEALLQQLKKKESFLLYRKGKNTPLIIIGKDETGVLYGCEEVRLRQQDIEGPVSLVDAPEMVLRGTAIGLQKTEYFPGRDVYEYPYTEELFPWFYDKDLWVRYLDMMLENRYNSLYLWNGHPFSSLVKLKEYPYAIEVDEATFAKN